MHGKIGLLVINSVTKLHGTKEREPVKAQKASETSAAYYRFQGVKHAAKNGIDLVATDGVSIKRTLLG